MYFDHEYDYYDDDDEPLVFTDAFVHEYNVQVVCNEDPSTIRQTCPVMPNDSMAVLHLHVCVGLLSGDQDKPFYLTRVKEGRSYWDEILDDRPVKIPNSKDIKVKEVFGGDANPKVWVIVEAVNTSSSRLERRKKGVRKDSGFAEF
ncbi:hypothetical protein GGF42_004756 [Coemansia sp. RSA 2424]|nr:hypothetical protein GGF42_004756 [Coemansia sp. RSA 2424]